MILLNPQSGNAQLAVEVKYGLVTGQIKNLDMYKEMSYILNRNNGNFLEKQIDKSVAIKYFFSKRFFSGFQMDFYDFETKRISEIIFKDYDYKYVETTMYYISLKRKRITSSFLLGYHIFNGFYLETGLSYMYNEKNILNGARVDDTGLFGGKGNITKKYVDQNFDKSSNFAGYLGLGFRYPKNGFYFMVDYKYFIEQPTQLSEDSRFKLKFDTQLFILGVGYKFGNNPDYN